MKPKEGSRAAGSISCWFVNETNCIQLNLIQDEINYCYNQVSHHSEINFDNLDLNVKGFKLFDFCPLL